MAWPVGAGGFAEAALPLISTLAGDAPLSRQAR